ncbi:hypothetical protein U1Q18_045383, partial [Sarracenia purpurea var. burkii]
MEDQTTSKSPSKQPSKQSKQTREVGPSNPWAKRKRKTGHLVSTSKNPKKVDTPSASSESIVIVAPAQPFRSSSL